MRSGYLVMLTACNTAASDGDQLSDALSGLAASFIRAGARSVLVSYWAADAEATEVFVKNLGGVTDLDFIIYTGNPNS
jgi:CHAT domain-containing protein